MKILVVSTLALASIGLAAGYLYGTVIDEPEYVSTSRLMVRDPKTSNQAKDYASIATSASVLNYAKADISASEDIHELKRYIKAVNLTGTNIIDISVTSSDPEMTKKLNQAVIDGIRAQAELLYRNNNLMDVDAVSEPRNIYSPNPLFSSLVGGGAGLIVGIGIAFVFYPQRKTNDEPKTQVRVVGDNDPRVPIVGSDAEPISDRSIHTTPLRRIDGVAPRRSKFSEPQDDKELDDILRHIEEKVKKP